jgi:hypothetical protein
VRSETDLQELDLYSVPGRARLPAGLPVVGPGSPLPLEVLYSFASLRGKIGGPVIAFTSARRKEGVTYVVRQLGRELAAYCRNDVLVISPQHLRRLRVMDAEQIEVVGQCLAPGLWTVPNHLPELQENSSPRLQEELWRTMRRRFGFILVDCGPLDSTSEVLSLGPRIDGSVLVVRAGFTAKPDIQKAARMLSLGSSPLLGCILNGRTYPVPGFLYRTL